MKNIKNIIILAMLLCAAFLPSVQAQITAFEVQPESCEPSPGHDGIATVGFPSGSESYFNVLWTYPDGSTSNSVTIGALAKGSYRVQVSPKDCPDKIVLDEAVAITRECDKRDVQVGITVLDVSSDPCLGTLEGTLFASAFGGEPPYHYSWPERRLRVAVNEHGSTFTCFVTDSLGNVGEKSITLYAKKQECSKDPNEISGPSGYTDDQRFVSAQERMGYSISFENDPDFATAPASRVTISYPIPPSQNISSFRLSDFGFGSHVFTVPANTSSYSTRLNVADSLGVWVDVTAGIDIVNNQAFWIFQSIDPATGFEPSNSQLGFLSINDSLGHGEGYVNFQISPKSNVHTGDTVVADATIVFDDNAPISTNVWKNTYDAVAPTSTLAATISTADTSTCLFTFAATDDAQGSGVQTVDLFVSENEGPYLRYGSYSLADTARITLANDRNYAFISQAVDNVGNRETFKTLPDTAINNNIAPTDILLAGASFRENAARGTSIGTFATMDNDVTLPFQYELVAGEGAADNALFQIVGNRLQTNNTFSCSGRFDYSIRVRTTDVSGLSFEKQFDIAMIQENFTKQTSSNVSICQGSSYTFGNNSYTTSGTYSDTLLTTLGCDSISTLRLSVFPSYQVVENHTVCDAYTWYDSTYLASTALPTHTLQTVAGCDSVLHLHLTVNHSNTAVDNQVACDSYTWTNGTTYTASTTTAQQVLTNAQGCDSTVTLHLTVNHSNTGLVSATACDSYTWHGTTYTASTSTATHTSTNAAGCDSVTTLHLTVNHSTAATDYQTACDSYTWDNGTTYTASNSTATRTVSNAVGCDSVITLHLTVNHSNTAVDNQSACDTYTWFGTTYTASTTTPQHVLTNAQGCDSTVTLHLTVNHSNSGLVSATACDSYTWHGTTYTASTSTATHTSTNAAGCDSVTTLHLTVNHSTAAVDNQVACDSYTWANGTTYTASNTTATRTVPNAVGCDSVITLHLTVNHSTAAVDNQVACDSYTWANGVTYTASNTTATHTVANAAGCDSVITLHLTLNHSTAAVDNQVACDTYTWFGTTYTASTTTPQHVLTNAQGCDSTVTLHLTVNHSSAASESATACDSYTWHGTTYTASTSTATHTATNAAGCDSVITLHLTVNHSSASTDNQVACDSYTWTNGETYTLSTTTPQQLFTNAVGCDSTVTLHLTLNHSTAAVDNQTACDTYTWFGTTYTASTSTATHTVANAAGCDSVITLHLTLNHSTAAVDNQSACDTYTWFGTTYTASTTTPQHVLTNAQGCDSTITLHLVVNYSTAATEADTACDSYTWHGTTYTASTTTATHTATNAAGCDSVTTLHLLINYSSAATDEQTACDSYTWTNGETYTLSTTTPQQLFTNAVGCDSTVTLHLVVNYSASTTDEQSACDSLTWIDGVTYTASTNQPTYVLSTAAGCDSTVTLLLDVHYSQHDTLHIDTLNSYQWNGSVYTESGIYQWAGQTDYGCDSLVTLVLNLTIEGINPVGLFDNLVVYPNPTSGMVYVQADQVLSIEVFDVNGRLVAHNQHSSSIDLSHLAEGYYTMRIALPQGTAIKRVIRR